MFPSATGKRWAWRGRGLPLSIPHCTLVSKATFWVTEHQLRTQMLVMYFSRQNNKQGPNPFSRVFGNILMFPEVMEFHAPLGKGGYKCDGERGRCSWHIFVCFLMWFVCVVWTSKWQGGCRKPHVSWSSKKLTYVPWNKQRWKTL